jgi:hypothetical protein
MAHPIGNQPVQSRAFVGVATGTIATHDMWGSKPSTRYGYAGLRRKREELQERKKREGNETKRNEKENKAGWGPAHTAPSSSRGSCSVSFIAMEYITSVNPADVTTLPARARASPVTSTFTSSRLWRTVLQEYGT